MLRFYYDPKYKYSNRTIIDVTGDGHYKDIDYENIDSPDTINGHIIYQLDPLETVPTYIVEDNNRRWFVSGITQLRTSKFQISLLRDLISESDFWKDEESYVNAGFANDFNKYKKWGLPFTNTKIKEERFNFAGKSSFFVFYVNENHLNGNAIEEDDLEIDYSSLPGVTSPDITVTNLNQLSHYDLFNNDLWYMTYSESNLFIKTGFVPMGENESNLRLSYYLDDSFNVNSYGGVAQPSIEIKTKASNIYNNVNNCKEDLKTAIKNFTQNYIGGLGVTQESYIADLNALEWKIVFNSTDSKYYRVRKDIKLVDVDNLAFSEATAPSLVSSIRNINFPVDAVTYNSNFYVPGQFFSMILGRQQVRYWLEYLGTGLSFNFNFTASVQKLSKSSVRCVNICSDNNFTNEDISKALMLAQENPVNLDKNTGQIIDIQYLPFSVADSTDALLQINSTALTAKFLDSDDFVFYTDLTDLTNINKETDTINIVSPSRGSQFVFSPYNNDGIMEFQTSITIKPFATAIYVRPSTKGLLMYDFDDKNCLSIKEDFSLTKVTSAWAEYVRANTNYENIFNRQQESRAVGRKWELKVESIQKKYEDQTARAVNQERIKNYAGGGIIGRLVSPLGLIAGDPEYLESAKLDRAYNQAMYEEAFNLAQDMFDMQIENLQAQPSIPSRITTIDCKLLDGIYLEYWSTNSTEINAINNYYKYNGNRIDCYGTFRSYYGWFVRGKIIKSKNYTQPELNELNRRLELGIYTEVEYAE